VALEEDGFLLSKKPTCPLINQIGDDISAPMNQPSACALKIFLAMVFLPMSISH
jgi:hypothetical protein